MDPVTGLRARKKAETRAALIDAALCLAGDRGLGAVTADAIADAAHVSVRTFHNYFPSKEEAVLEPFRSLMAHLVEALRARPPEEPILVSLEAVWRTLASGELELPEDALERVAAPWTSPAMRADRFRLLGEAIRLFVVPVGERTGTDPEVDLYPHLVTTAAVAALIATLMFRPDQDPSSDERIRLVGEAFAILRTGFRLPSDPMT